MNKEDNKIDEVQEDNFTGLDDGLAGSSEDAYDSDYTIQSVRLGNKVMNKRIGTFTPKTEADKAKDELPSLDEKLAEAEEKFNAQFQSSKPTEKDELEK
ncbi:MAG: hypothetical protein HFH60_10255 [Lachnospiraceae bacterium]|jgi:hypothetical protein|nr:hypothetical protein [Lachnospiraceae bacterium]